MTEEVLKRLKRLEAETLSPLVRSIIDLIEDGRPAEDALLEGLELLSKKMVVVEDEVLAYATKRTPGPMQVIVDGHDQAALRRVKELLTDPTYFDVRLNESDAPYWPWCPVCHSEAAIDGKPEDIEHDDYKMSMPCLIGKLWDAVKGQPSAEE